MIDALSTTHKIEGISLPDENFRLHETNRLVDVPSVLKVLKGELAAYRIRQYLPLNDSHKIAKNFWASLEKKARYGEGEDGVEGYFLGASHIEKTTLEYLDEVQSFEKAVNNLYEGTIDPLASFKRKIISESNELTKARPASYNGLLAGNSKAVYWNNIGDFLLQPHDDIAQLSCPKQENFEIQKATRVMAINFYAKVPGNAGQLKIWNIEPNKKSRKILGLTYSGFPYPPELLRHFKHIIIPVETGDLCVINGNLIHAVIRGDPIASARDRLLITCFTTCNDKHELISWT